MLIQLLFVMLAAVNIAAYFFMWKDKVRAVRHGWRISENTFFLLSLLGGFIGVYCGMKRFRDRKSTRLNSSHNVISRMPSSA